mmetsp:Transcript_34117/g.96686  ORF Transcript_34117/g.96686 Transcript_34117/m.96686 type:complete len:315 (-) Transcript_34117:598-1542(-)
MGRDNSAAALMLTAGLLMLLCSVAPAGAESNNESSTATPSNGTAGILEAACGTPCSRGTFRAKPCGNSAVHEGRWECQACSICPEGWFLQSSCNATSDSICQECRTCDDGELQECNNLAVVGGNRICQAGSNSSSTTTPDRLTARNITVQNPSWLNLEFRSPPERENQTANANQTVSRGVAEASTEEPEAMVIDQVGDADQGAKDGDAGAEELKEATLESIEDKLPDGLKYQDTVDGVKNDQQQDPSSKVPPLSVPVTYLNMTGGAGAGNSTEPTASPDTTASAPQKSSEETDVEEIEEEGGEEPEESTALSLD